MKQIIRPLIALLLALPLLAACEENLDETPAYNNWKQRNTGYFKQKLDEAHRAMAEAKNAYGDDWEAHCDWRAFPSYSLTSATGATAADSIVVHIARRGEGPGCPLYTDSVAVNFLGRTIPNEFSDNEEARTKGAVFDYSGLSRDSSIVFSDEFCAPARFVARRLAEGFTTALLLMHVGDQWRVYIPQELGYQSNSATSIPAYSTLVFDIQLKAYSRSGTPLPAIRQ